MKIFNTIRKMIRKFKRFLLGFFREKRAYGFVHGKNNVIDFIFKAGDDIKVPSFVNLNDGFPPSYDQGTMGSCTANAIGALIQFNQIKQNKKHNFMPSRLFIYYNEREMNGQINKDAGASIHDGIKSVNKQGVCKEELHPYIPKKMKVKPSPRAYEEALLHRSTKYFSIDNKNINDMKSCLAGGFPFALGFMIYDSFETEEVADTGIMPLPEPYELCLGGHAVVCIGYDDDKEAFLIRNSWGSKWGDHGNFWMPYGFMTSDDVMDCWIIKEITSE